MKKLLLIVLASIAFAGCDPKILVYGASSDSPIFRRKFDEHEWHTPSIDMSETSTTAVFTVVFEKKTIKSK